MGDQPVRSCFFLLSMCVFPFQMRMFFFLGHTCRSFCPSCQEKNITEEIALVVSCVKSSECYEDMRSFADTCDSWLETLVAMAPDSVRSSFTYKKDDPDEPLSPSSKLLRSQFFASSSPSADLLSKYETNLRSKLTDVVTLRKKLDKMLQKQCASTKVNKTNKS